MKRILLLLWALIAIATTSSAFYNGDKDKCCSGKSAAKCTGKDPCTACSNCSQCKYCHAGGTCGACKKKPASYGRTVPTPSKNKTPDANAGQCKAITKSGTRCKRAARSNGYCWQHGG